MQCSGPASPHRSGIRRYNTVGGAEILVREQRAVSNNKRKKKKEKMKLRRKEKRRRRQWSETGEGTVNPLPRPGLVAGLVAGEGGVACTALVLDPRHVLVPSTCLTTRPGPHYLLSPTGRVSLGPIFLQAGLAVVTTVSAIAPPPHYCLQPDPSPGPAPAPALLAGYRRGSRRRAVPQLSNTTLDTSDRLDTQSGSWTEGSLVLSPGLERVEGVLGRQGDCGRQLRLIRLTPDLLSWISAVITQNPHITRVN